MERLRELRKDLDRLDAGHLRRRRRVVRGRSGATLQLADEGGERSLVGFCSNDYLGLATDPAVVAALREGASRHGAGSGASALICGHHQAHEALEARFAELLAPHIPGCRALLFGTGYLANLATLGSLADRETDAFCEALNHASLIDGVQLAHARRRVYAHADVADLERQLRASTARRKLIVTDAVFSMDGDLAPLPQLLERAREHEALLMVDDAHGFGVLGERGLGSLAHFGLRDERLVYVGTLGKALGVAGAFVAAHADVIETLVQRARPYIYSTAPPPALAHALACALDIATGARGDALRRRLGEHIERWRRSMAPWSRRLLDSRTAIQPFMIGDNASTMEIAAELGERGFWVPGIRPPTVPAAGARLRITLSAAHATDDVERLAETLDAVLRARGVDGADPAWPVRPASP